MNCVLPARMEGTREADWQLAGSLGLRDLVYMTPAQGPKTSECANHSDSELCESDT